jgi:hypothetical protein
MKLKDLELSLEKMKINYEVKEIEFLKDSGFDEDGDKKDRNGRRSLRITKDELSILNDRYLGDKSDRNNENLFAPNSGSENSVQSSTSSCRFGDKDNADSDFDADSVLGKSEKNDHENEHENDVNVHNENENENKNENEKTSKSFSEKFARNNRYKFQDSSEMSEERDKSPRTHGTTSRLAMIEAILKNYNYYEDDDLISNVGQPDCMAPNQPIRNERKTWETEIPSSNKTQNEGGIWSMKSYSNSNGNSNSSSNSNRNSSSNRSNTRDTVIGSFAWQIPLIKIRSTYLLQKALSHRYHRRKPSESYTSHYNSNTSNKSNYNSNNSNYNNNNSSKNNDNSSNNNSNNNNNCSVNPWSILEGSSSESHDKIGQNDPQDNVINKAVKESKLTYNQSNSLRNLVSTIKIPSTVCTVS